MGLIASILLALLSFLNQNGIITDPNGFTNSTTTSERSVITDPNGKIITDPNGKP